MELSKQKQFFPILYVEIVPTARNYHLKANSMLFCDCYRHYICKGHSNSLLWFLFWFNEFGPFLNMFSRL